MSKQHHLSSEVGSILIGVVTSVGIGTFLLHALSAFTLALMGAAGGWVFQQFIKPRLDQWKVSRDSKKNAEKA